MRLEVLRQRAKDLNKESFSIVSADDVPGTDSKPIASRRLCEAAKSKL